MIVSNSRESALLLVGDIVSFYISLWLMLAIRYFEFPTTEQWTLHVVPFSLLFVVWIIVFFIAGLYEKHTLILKSKIDSAILNAQIANSFLATLFFYFVPYFGIAPKTNLFIYLFVSFALILVWRLQVFPSFESKKKQNALLIGSGTEMDELEKEVNNNSRYNLYFISSIDLDKMASLDFQEEIVKRVYSEDVFVIVADFKNEKVEPLLPRLYNLMFSKIKFIDMHKIYEDIFDRIPLSLVKYSWFLENISAGSRKGYDALKRLSDIAVASVLGAGTLIIVPLVWVLVKLDDGGPLLFTQERVGRNNKMIRIVKFRSMGTPREGGDMRVTRVGAWLRKTRIDELPQLWNVIKGDISLIGPRPEIPTLVKVYEDEIPYYNVRHLIKPGLSGWAQLYGEHAHHSGDVLKTKNKLSYDLYYIKNRSVLLDLKIALRTLKVVLSREGI